MSDIRNLAISISATIQGISHEVISLSGQEKINELFRFKLIIATANPQNLYEWSNQPITISLSTDQYGTARTIVGMVTKIKQQPKNQDNLFQLSLTVEPRLKSLQHQQESRVWTHKSSKKIISELLSPLGYNNRCWQIFDTHSPIDKPVDQTIQGQNERHFEFFKRLLSWSGISFYWQSPTLHTCMDGLILAHINNYHASELPFQFELGERKGYFATALSILSHHQLNRNLDETTTLHQNLSEFPHHTMTTCTAGMGPTQVIQWTKGNNQGNLAEYHQNALTAEQISLRGETIHPGLACADTIDLPGEKFLLPSPQWRIYAINHEFKNGQYHNQLTLTPRHQTIQLPISQETIGQITQTVKINGHETRPLLDEFGQYQCQRHIDNNGQSIIAPKITPFGGSSHGNTMGVHFPLHRDAESLMFFLQNNLHRPVLINSLHNGQNHPIIQADNSWLTSLRSQWGQYLTFCDKENETSVTLANGQEKNIISLGFHPEKPGIQMRCEQGTTLWQAQIGQKWQSMDEINWHGSNQLYLAAKHTIRYHCDTWHLDAKKQQIRSTCQISVDAQKDLMLSGNAIQIHGQNVINIHVKGDCQHWLAQQEQINIDADEISLVGNQEVQLACGSTNLVLCENIQLDSAALDLQSDNVSFGTPAEYITQPAVAISNITLASIPHPAAIPRQSWFGSQKISRPQWQSAILDRDGFTQILVEINGFEGYEVGQLFIHSLDEDTDTPRQSLTADDPGTTISGLDNRLHPEVDPVALQHDFSLGEETQYLHPENIDESPGNTVLRFNIPTSDLLDTLPGPFYIRVQIDGIYSHVSPTALVLGKRQLAINSTHRQPVAWQQAVLSVKRHWPKTLTADPQTPKSLTTQWCESQQKISQLPLGNRTHIAINVRGRMAELLEPSNQTPHWLKPLPVDKQDNLPSLTYHALPEPMIISIRNAELDNVSICYTKDGPYQRDHLYPDEIEQIKKQGQLTIFVHGYNVPMGEFGRYLADSPEPEWDEATCSVLRTKCDLSAAAPNQLKAAIENNQINLDNLNGTGVHEWITHLENHINRANKFDGQNYQSFERLLFLSWPGDPESSLDYNIAVKNSIAYAKVFVQLLINIHKDLDSAIPINIISHSQGCGLVVQTLNQLGSPETLSANKIKLNQVYLCQAAIPNYALNEVLPEHIKQSNIPEPWQCPHAIKACHNIYIFSSKNDNILGRLLSQGEQPTGVDLQSVWDQKPWVELVSSIICTNLQIDGLYVLATEIGATTHDLMDLDRLKQLWKHWVDNHPSFMIGNTQYDAKESIEEQFDFFKQHTRVNLQILEHAHQRLSQGLLVLKHYLNDKASHPAQQSELSEIVLSGLSPIIRTLLSGLLTPSPVSIVCTEAIDVTGELFHNLAERLNHPGIIGKIDDIYLLINYLLTFTKVVLFSSRQNRQDGERYEQAMGYEGLTYAKTYDPSIRKHLENGTIQEINHTNCYWEHSQIKQSSDDLDKAIYKKFFDRTLDSRH